MERTRRSLADHVLCACAAGLWLACVGGCPSKGSQDSNQPPATASPPPATSNEQPATHNPQRSAVAHYGYRVVKTYPHDPQAFTQGLVYENGILYEGTGLYGRSVLTKRDLKSGRLLKRERLPRRYFGEGITVFRDKIFQLTWQSQTGFVYDKTTFRLLKEFKYTGEGWGLTHDGKNLIMSDGTANLRFLDPNTLAETRRVTVHDEHGPIDLLNGLEYVAPPPPGMVDSNSQPRAAGPHIFANIWSSDFIAVISPETGQVTAWLDLSTLYPRPADSEFVLNGIAYLPESNHLLITGKCWPKLHEIELIAQPPTSQQ
ncbi:MAG: glutaminyl-peptide cyclotransferase [Sedimentisphaerales bacterium]|nr:glutaminyl-peptide cyclotransferase [Sedimentisphaerales bacterium]